MQAAPSFHSDDMSQGKDTSRSHPKAVLDAVDPASRRTRGVYRALRVSAVGIELAVSVLVGLLFGHWLDDKLGTTPWLMIVFLMLGFAAGFRALLRSAKRAERALTEEERRGKP